MEDLGIIQLTDAALLSEEEGVEKPSCEIFQRACQRVGVASGETVHIGDELDWCVIAGWFVEGSDWQSGSLLKQ